MGCSFCCPCLRIWDAMAGFLLIAWTNIIWLLCRELDALAAVVWFLATVFDWTALVTCNSNHEQTVNFFLLTLGSFVEALSPSSIFMCLSLSMSDTNFEPRPAQDQRMTRGTERCKTCNYFAANLVLGSKSRQLFHGTLLRPRMEGATQCISTASNFGGANKFETCWNQSDAICQSNKCKLAYHMIKCSTSGALHCSDPWYSNICSFKQNLSWAHVPHGISKLAMQNSKIMRL